MRRGEKLPGWRQRLGVFRWRSQQFLRDFRGNAEKKKKLGWISLSFPSNPSSRKFSRRENKAELCDPPKKI